MLLAYTNRAVDEICSMLDGLGEGIRKKYLRIGSRISTGEKYKSQLLSQRIEGIATRRELRQMLASQRVVVGTISSIAGKPELFDLLNFDCAIIDEASQILEPLLADILLKFPKWVLIGDHKQLPAVVAQDERLTRLDDDVLAGINLTDTRMSYFERIFTLCESNNWTWAVGKLYEQGRMHSEIMRFPSQEFYGGILRALAHVEGVRDLNGLLPQPNSSGSGLQSALAGKRMIFVRSEEPVSLPWNKTNDFEAEAVALITGRLLKLNSELGRNWSIGIVTPFRAQIANIRHKLKERQIDPGELTIDTVERYQGTARDIIVMSLCVTDIAQLDQISSKDNHGVDRKLNVAITRAREQFIWIGSPRVVDNDAVYRRLREMSVAIEVSPADISSVADIN